MRGQTQTNLEISRIDRNRLRNLPVSRIGPLGLRAAAFSAEGSPFSRNPGTGLAGDDHLIILHTKRGEKDESKQDV